MVLDYNMYFIVYNGRIKLTSNDLILALAHIALLIKKYQFGCFIIFNGKNEMLYRMEIKNKK